MVGVGAVVGTLSGGYTDAARSPVVALAISEASDQTTNTSVVNMTARQAAKPDEAAPEPAPMAVVAARFPGNWQQPGAQASNGDNDTSAQVLAYAAEPRRTAPVRDDAERAEPVRPAAASASGFRLASVDRAAEPEPAPVPLPKRMARPAPAKPPVLFNDAQLASIKARLKLSRDQEAYWPPVESALRAISWKIATQPGAHRGKQQAAMIDPNSPEVGRLKSAAFPLIMSMRSDQKEEVRQLAHTMGLKQVASMF